MASLPTIATYLGKIVTESVRHPTYYSRVRITEDGQVEVTRSKERSKPHEAEAPDRAVTHH